VPNVDGSEGLFLHGLKFLSDLGGGEEVGVIMSEDVVFFEILF